MRRRLPVVLTALALSLSGVTPTRAAIGSKMPVTDWYTPGQPGGTPYSNLKLVEYFGIVPTARAGQDEPGHYFINQFWTLYGNGGYKGLLSAPGEQKAIFSWWGAIDVYCAGVPNLRTCGSFDNEGTGKTVQLNYAFVAGRNYQHEVAYGWQDSVGIWWNSYLTDLATGVTTFTGSLKTPLAWGRLQGTAGQLIEHLGATRADTCDEIAKASVWRSPARFDGVNAPTHYNHIGYDANPCPASVFDHNGGVVQEIGTP